MTKIALSCIVLHICLQYTDALPLLHQPLSSEALQTSTAGLQSLWTALGGFVFLGLISHVYLNNAGLHCFIYYHSLEYLTCTDQAI